MGENPRETAFSANDTGCNFAGRAIEDIVHNPLTE
jgi:hypothetical protein